MNAENLHRLAQLTAKVRGASRLRAARSPEAFGRLYLAHHLDKPPNRMHRELNELLVELTDQPGGRLALAAPRGSAKSTWVSLIHALWCICHRKFRFIVLVSDTAEKAAEFLDHIKHELVENRQLAEDYPEVCEPEGRRPSWPRWRSQEIITHNGVKVLAMGWGQSIRGRRHRATRPDLFILDDVESRDNTHTPEARAKVLDSFNKTILKAGTKETRLIMIGTLQHYDALLARLIDPVKSPTWQGRIYRSVVAWSGRTDLWERWSAILHHRDEHDGRTGPQGARAYFEAHEGDMLQGTDTLWPEVEDYYTLMLMREAEGPASFDSEKQNEPVNPEDCFFLEADFVYWDDKFAGDQMLIQTLGQDGEYIGACDPSLGKQGRHADDSAIITLLRDKKSGALYVLDADIARRKPDRLIEDILDYQRIRHYARFAIESNQFQAFLADELQRRSNQAGLYLRTEPVNHTTDKLGRIQSLQPLVRSGALQFSRRHRVLLDQLRYFPRAAHDDGPDALEMAVATARQCARLPKPIFAPAHISDWGGRW